MKRNALIFGNFDTHRYDTTEGYRVNSEIVRKETNARLFVDGEFHFPNETIEDVKPKFSPKIQLTSGQNGAQNTQMSNENGQNVQKPVDKKSSPIPETYAETNTETSDFQISQKFENGKPHIKISKNTIQGESIEHTNTQHIHNIPGSNKNPGNLPKVTVLQPIAQASIMSQIKKLEAKERIVWGEVYSPLRPDADGEYMDVAEVKKMSYGFMKNMALNQIDSMHDNVLVPNAQIVESFIARKGDEDFIEGSWVVGVHIPGDADWAKVEKGEWNGFSVEALME